MPKKRHNGDGGLWKRKDGRWVAVLDLGYEPATDKTTGAVIRNSDGSPKMRRARKYYYGATQAAVKQRLEDDRKVVAAGGTVATRKTTTADYLAWWQENVLPGTVKDSVAAGYGEILRLYATPYVGSTQLAELTPALLAAWMRTLEKRGLAPRTRKQARSVLRRALRDAVDLRLLQFNPLDGVRGPKVGRAQVTDVLSGDEARRLLEFVEGDRLEAAFRLALSTGLRRGEILGLQWGDVDLDGGMLTVRRAQKWSSAGVSYDTPKTEAARRTIPMPPSTIASLQRHRAAQRAERKEKLKVGAGWGDASLVFATVDGGPIPPRSFLRYWYRATERSGLGRTRLHGARHTCATTQLEAGVPLHEVGAALGHSSYSVTVDSYGHLAPASLAKGAAAMEAALGGGQRG